MNQPIIHDLNVKLDLPLEAFEGHKAILKDPEVNASVLLIVAIDIYGPEILDWEPLTIQLELEEFLGEPFESPNFSKLLAAMSILKSYRFYHSPVDFIVICEILNGSIISPSYMVEPDITDVAWGVFEAFFIDFPEEEDLAKGLRNYLQTIYSDQIKKLIEIIVINSGLPKAPILLDKLVPDIPNPIKSYLDMGLNKKFVESLLVKTYKSVDDVNKYVLTRFEKNVDDLKKITLLRGDNKKKSEVIAMVNDFVKKLVEQQEITKEFLERI
jgi:hypothetical protein